MPRAPAYQGAYRLIKGRGCRALQKVVACRFAGTECRKVSPAGFPADMLALIAHPFSPVTLNCLLDNRKGSNRDTAVFAMVNSDWRDRAKAAFERMLAPDSSVNLKRAKARARARDAAAAAAAVAARDGGSIVGVTNPKEKDK